MTTPPAPAADGLTGAATDELVHDRRIAEELQDRLRREQQTARALREYLLSRRDARG